VELNRRLDARVAQLQQAEQALQQKEAAVAAREREVATLRQGVEADHDAALDRELERRRPTAPGSSFREGLESLSRPFDTE
ncbi:MAG TPA: hypothetical protein VFM96_15640, partial [Gaiellaceae bacterium]|nr:hypothetical protein [Gaiellaceae bacterium]